MAMNIKNVIKHLDDYDPIFSEKDVWKKIFLVSLIKLVNLGDKCIINSNLIDFLYRSLGKIYFDGKHIGASFK